MVCARVDANGTRSSNQFSGTWRLHLPVLIRDSGNLTFILTYVDDILVGSNSRDKENQISQANKN